MVININDIVDDERPHSMGEVKYQVQHPKTGAFFSGQPKNSKQKLIDWHDYRHIAEESRRTGIGEHGVAAHLPPEDEHERKLLFSKNGFNGLLSDRISLNRSVADIRHKE